MKYLITRAIPKQTDIRLFCFHYAGGGASCFNHWKTLAKNDLAICPIQLPGRESRFREPRFTDFQEMIDELYEQLAPYLQQDYAFYGHSLGALIAYALAQKLHAAREKLPVALFVGAHRAPHLPYRFPSSTTMGLEELKKLLSQYEGISQHILDNHEWMEVLLPIIKDDLSLCETYKHHPISINALPCPLYAFGGLSDRMVSQVEILAWGQHTSKEFRSHFYSGGHFFLKSHTEELLNFIELTLQNHIKSIPQTYLSVA
ncbi:MAG: thioesterase domain-containing protein [Xenococcaceae cyanobacterium MO_167.B27]|nr:thioesterase domain-containing protein [Xenococcaceae cyanobacterium MO_167.B27]